MVMDILALISPSSLMYCTYIDQANLLGRISSKKGGYDGRTGPD